MAALSLNDRMQLLSEQIEQFRSEVENTSPNFPLHNLTALQKTYASLRCDFATLQRDAALLHLPKWDEISKGLSKIGADLKISDQKVQQLRNKMISEFAAGPVTRNLSNQFNILEITSNMISDEFEQSPGPLQKETSEQIGIYCANAEIEIGDHERIGSKATELLEQWRDHAFAYAMK